MSRPIDMSYSMRVDDITGTSPDSTLQIRQRNVDSWIADDAVTQCQACGTTFGWLTRKHHCRCCGRIFCYECSSNRDQLPRDLERYPSGSTAWLHLSWSKSKAERTCDKCHLRLQRTRYVWNDVRVFDLLELDLVQLRTLSLVSKRWCRAAVCSLSAFREIQYRLPVQTLSDRERKQLLINQRWLAGHSLWCWQLFRSQPSDQLLDLLGSERSVPCGQTMCTRHCSRQLSPENALYLLMISTPCPAVRSFAIKRLEDPQLYMLPHLVYALRFELPEQSVSLLDRLIKMASHPTVRRKLFWLIKVENAACYPLALQRLIQTYDCSLLQAGAVALKEMPSETNCTLPVFDGLVSGIRVDQIKVKCSASRPKVWPCLIGGETKLMLYKTQQVKSDLIVMSVIQYMDRVLKAEGLDLGIVTYEVMPIGNHSGTIAMVPAETLDEIQSRGSLLNYMLSHNESARVGDLRQRFIRSTAAYCVISYVLGIGDRHLENIMMTGDGRLFHIDFGFILGSDPKPYAATAMRLSESMVEAIGGVHSKEYAEFQSLCTRVYNCLRQHVLEITTLLLLVPVDEQQLRSEILARFVPGENPIEAQVQLTSRIEDSRSSYKANAIDFLHQHGQTLSLRRLFGILYED